MRRKLWLLLILFLFLVGRESCCASQEQNQGKNIGQNQEQNIGLCESLLRGFDSVQKFRENHKFLFGISGVLFGSLSYWLFDLHQKGKGWYTCKFYYAGGYRTKLFYNRIYFDFYSSFPRMIIGLYKYGVLRGLVGFSFLININVRIYRGFYIVFTIPVLYNLLSEAFPSSQSDIDN